MTFEQLPSTWPDQPLTDPALAADVVDLMVSIGDRHLGVLAVLLCHPDDRFRSTVIVELPPFPGLSPTEACRTALDPVISSIQAAAPGTGIVLALGCRVSTSLDLEWAAAANALCEAAGVRLLGFYVAASDRVRQPELGALT